MAENFKKIVTWLKTVLNTLGVEAGVIVSILAVLNGFNLIPIKVFGYNLLDIFVFVISIVISIQVIVQLILSLMLKMKKKWKEIKEVI